MIKATNLTKNYGEQRAVDIPELIIPDGTILGLVGNNGAGKTTLFRLLLDLIKATDGEVGLSKSDDCELCPMRGLEAFCRSIRQRRVPHRLSFTRRVLSLCRQGKRYSRGDCKDHYRAIYRIPHRRDNRSRETDSRPISRK